MRRGHISTERIPANVVGPTWSITRNRSRLDGQLMQEILQKIDQRFNQLEAQLKDMLPVSPWLTFQECCEYLRVGRTKLRALVENSRLKVIRLDGQMRFLRKDCDAFMLYEKPYQRLTRPQKAAIDEINGISK